MEKDLVNIIKTLNKHKIPYMLIGGFAVILYGVRRTTFDIDIAISPSPATTDKTIMLLSRLNFVQVTSNIHPNYGMKFSNGQTEIDLMFIENTMFNILYAHHNNIKYKDTMIKMPNIMDLVSLKESSTRDKDIKDAIELRNIATLRMRKK